MTFKEFESLFKENTIFEYVACDGKRRISKNTLSRQEAVAFLKDDSIHTKENKSIGLIIPEGYVVVDIDEGKEEAKRALRALNVKTTVVETPKGLHLFFKTNKKLSRKVGVITPFGLKCDQLTASTSYVILPPNNKKRKFFMKHKVTKLPKMFTPLINQKESLLGLCDGDGRNSRLISVLASLKKKFKSIDEDDLYTLAHFINTTIFNEPLKNREIDYIINSIETYTEQEQKTFNGSIKIKDYRETIEILGMVIDRYDENGRNRFLTYNEKGKPVDLDHLELADLLVKAKTFCVSNKQIYRFDNGVYVECGQEVRDLIKNLASITHVTKQSRIMEAYNSILDDIRLRVEPSKFEADPNLINFENCIWDINKGEVKRHSPDKYFKTKVPHKLSKDFTPIQNTCLWELLDLMEVPYDDRKMLFEFMAYTLVKDNSLRSFLMLVGQGGSGKSLLITFLSKMVGEMNTAAVSLQDLNKRFQASALENKMLNVCADNKTSALHQIDVIKRITGGDTLTCEYKGRDPYPFKPFAKLCFSFNQMPLQLEEKSNAFYDRMRILHMDKRINVSKKFANKLFSETEMSMVLSYLIRMLPLDKVSKSKNSVREAEIARKRSDSIYDFIKSEFIEDPNAHVPKDEVFEMYSKYCRRTQRTPHAYYIFFDYLMDYPFIKTVMYEHKGQINDYIKGLRPKRKKITEPLGKLLNPLGEDEEDQEISFDLPVTKLKKKTMKKKETKKLLIEFDFTNVRKPLEVELDFTDVTEPLAKRLKPKIYEIDFGRVKKTLVFEFDFTGLKDNRYGNRFKGTYKKSTYD